MQMLILRFSMEHNTIIIKTNAVPHKCWGTLFPSIKREHIQKIQGNCYLKKITRFGYMTQKWKSGQFITLSCIKCMLPLK